MRALLLKNWHYKLFSLVLAIAFSYYIYGFSSYEVEASLSFNLEIRNLSARLAIATEVPSRVAVSVRGRTDAIREGKVSAETAFLDFANITEPGKYVITPQLALPEALKLLKPIKAVSVEIDPAEKREIPVEVVERGNIPEGYVLNRIEFNPKAVTIEGPRRHINRSKRAVVELELAGRRSRIAQSLPVQVVDDDYRPVSARFLSISPLTVYVRADVNPVANVKPLKVVPSLVGEPADGYYLKEVTIEPAQILVEGKLLEGKKIKPLIVTEAINLDGKRQSFTVEVGLKYPIEKPDALQDKAKITVEIQRLTGSEDVLSVKIDLIGRREGFTYVLEPSAVSVQSPDLASLMEEERLEVSASFDARDLGVGVYRIVPQFRLPEGLGRIQVIPSTVLLTVRERVEELPADNE